MICRNCLRAASRVHIKPTIPIRTLTTSPAVRNATPISTTTATQSTPSSASSPPPATTTSAAQPFSAPQTPSPKKASAPPKPKTIVMSSVPAGTPLKGLNFIKGQNDPVAMEDSEYPSWLWGILKKKEDDNAAAGGMGDLFSKSKKQRRVAAKRLRREQLLNPGLLTPKIPIYEQTIDLPAGDGTVTGAVQAASAREELNKAMRVKRRGVIKETNFLKAMR